MASRNLTRFEQRNDVVIITFDRDEKLNAFNAAMTAEVAAHLDRAQQANARVVILRANPGVRVWCAGRDLSELRPGVDPADDPMLKLFEQIMALPLPVLSMVEGAVYGGGLMLTMASDIVIAANNATVAMTANKLGIPLPTETYAYWMRILGLHKMKELLFTASAISAQDAYIAGIFNHIVEPEHLESYTLDVIARRILECSPEGIANAKQQLNLLAQRYVLTEVDRRVIDEHRYALLNGEDFHTRLTQMLAQVEGKAESR
ncbi:MULTISPECIES: enoyl-CoA hydratase-related protein [Caldilinea]|jgi:methylmalonyl-CoA decarboxylase|uniref:Enoyl-CoA hydratase/isomerase family protein n=1 Tax=Caldilinea aerophila (strain DSM 14535 / JCM 11387 / NBRC 104270 / STL-6-O1) TaxID=926550 RepID=I0HZU1_CALAS|nr:MULTISPECIES: enoyl-CoA hydratase-related protein [Caldilinea]MBO9394331.1 enoyl-CoA hydratase/isomerase family protein [Caldilinea sp.]BAL98528.1 enoyl-CoA hydratase/isomerase family protein [Caldilinea aerophila DSM 14535 = NBRC 104270]GIV74893.1 MAG: methylmalonyl-CoA decarboxylase [Caldilinea sp.]